MPLDREQRATLEYLQSMLHGLRITAYSQNLDLMVYLLDMALIEAGDCVNRDASAKEAAADYARQSRKAALRPALSAAPRQSVLQ